MKTGWKLLLIYTFFVIVWGAFVRASGSGDGCGAHWPSCHGGYILESSSTKTLIEYTHRATSGLYGIFVLLLSIMTMFSARFSRTAKIFAFGVLTFTILESLVGAKLVLSELVGSNASHARALVMIIHLSNTLLLVACNTGVIFFDDKKTKFTDLTHLKKWGPVLLLFLITGASGALAALGDTLYPSESLLKGFSMDFDPQSPWLIKVRSFHPFFAFALTASVIWITDPKRRFGLSLIGLGLSTLIVGLINLALLAPLPLQLGHLTIAMSFWVICLMYFFDLSTGKKLQS
ncbi:MAG: COX15/CtaA family protein [Bdellovibrionales bacterium]